MKKHILCYGDSNTYGHDPATAMRFPDEVRWVNRLQQRLGSDYCVIGEGLNSRTAGAIPPGEAYQNGLALLEPCMRSHQPLDLVIIMLGTNDLKKDFDPSPERIAMMARQLVLTAYRVNHEANNGKADGKVLLVSPFLVRDEIADHPYGEMYGGTAAARLSEQLAPLYEKVAEETGCEFINAADFVQVSPIDGLHLDAGGHEKFAQLMEDEVRRILE